MFCFANVHKTAFSQPRVEFSATPTLSWQLFTYIMYIQYENYIAFVSCIFIVIRNINSYRLQLWRAFDESDQTACNKLHCTNNARVRRVSGIHQIC